ncbi:hypothetical protein [Streptomyces sp. NPDC017520]|uniref:hypothetical protein n=1 Tax=Streptomyces sp. NPDC017520 TaxID=3364998 RepID=UPI00378EACA9
MPSNLEPSEVRFRPQRPGRRQADAVPLPLDTGADTWADIGADTEADTEADTGADTGADIGADIGADTEADTGRLRGPTGVRRPARSAVR